MATGSSDALLATTTSPEVFAFEAEVASLELLDDAGKSSGNLLNASAPAELTGLTDGALWTAEGEIPAGIYTSARAVFADSFAAKGTAGEPLDVVASGLVLAEPLLEPLALAEGGYARVEIYLDLVGSLTEAVPPGQLEFAPSGAFRALPHAEDAGLAPFYGIVTAASLAEKTLAVDAYRDAALTQPLRTVDVTLADGALLVDLNDVVFPGVEDFYATLVLGQTVIEVEGSLLGSGGVLADRVEILSHTGMTDPKVVITGKVLNVDGAAQELVLLIQHVDQGAELAGPALASIGDPSAIDVSWSESTAFLDHDGELDGPTDLSVGQMVQVEFAAFSSPPFPAAKIELLGLSLTGTIDDVAGLPDTFVLRLGGGDLVTVHLSETTELRLDTQFKPEIQTSELVVGMKATVAGDLHSATGEGDPVVDGVDAQSVKVHHGYLVQADVAAADELVSTFFTSTGHVAQTFGVLAPEGPLAVVIQPGCLFGQDAASEAEFFALVATGAELDVKVKGIGSNVPGEIHAYDLKAKKKP